MIIAAVGPGFCIIKDERLISLKAANDPPSSYCDRCKGFGRILGNRVCPDCHGDGVLFR